MCDAANCSGRMWGGVQATQHVVEAEHDASALEVADSEVRLVTLATDAARRAQQAGEPGV